MTEARKALRIIFTGRDQVLFECTRDVLPGKPFRTEIELSEDYSESDLLLRVLAADGQEIIAYQPQGEHKVHLPDPATEPPPPAEISTVEELYLTALLTWNSIATPHALLNPIGKKAYVVIHWTRAQ